MVNVVQVGGVEEEERRHLKGHEHLFVVPELMAPTYKGIAVGAPWCASGLCLMSNLVRRSFKEATTLCASPSPLLASFFFLAVETESSLPPAQTSDRHSS